jgi:undecaprenyl-diphosphatase
LLNVRRRACAKRQEGRSAIKPKESILRLTLIRIVVVIMMVLVPSLTFSSDPSLGQTGAVPEVESQPVDGPVVSPAQAVVLGLVEGITEFLPISSTGHLILAGDVMGLRDPKRLTPEQYEATQAFEIVIQSGAILAVLVIFGSKLWQMFLGLLGCSPEGRKMLINIMAAFIPTAGLGLLLHKLIKTYLQSTGPVIFALAAGGVAMIFVDRTPWGKRSREAGLGIDSLTIKGAVMIGLFQCVAMWPGTSRSMMTIIGGMAMGLHPAAAAEFSFVLGLPTLLAATALKVLKEGPLLIKHIGVTAMATGLLVAALSAFFAVKGFVAFLNRKGLAVFGWYRLILALVVWWTMGRS